LNASAPKAREKQKRQKGQRPFLPFLPLFAFFASLLHTVIAQPIVKESPQLRLCKSPVYHNQPIEKERAIE
jgi:hypothetical protein